jgi:predicted O-methyltransferase YrrM
MWSLFRKKSDLRPLESVTPQPAPSKIEQLRGGAFYADVVAYFTDFPAYSLMSDHSRAMLFSIIKVRRPTYIAEIGTFRASTTEVMARACWENNWGGIDTTDPFPFTGRRRHPIIASWPKDLQKYVRFHPLTSMGFFSDLDRRRISLDLTLIDGDHDYEYASFDLQMTARRTRPSGIVVMDNAEQSGPFHAARTFLAANPTWRELGRAIADYHPDHPFDPARASAPDTGFIMLQAPAFIPIGAGPHSWGPMRIDQPAVAGLALQLARPANGTLHYQVTLRAFLKDEQPVEQKAIGAVKVEATTPQAVSVPFTGSLKVPEREIHTVEIDLSWNGVEALALTVPPAAINGEKSQAA